MQTIERTTIKTHPTYCPMCYEPSEEVVVGEVFRYIDKHGKLIGYGYPGGILGLELTEYEVDYTVESVDGERLPGGHPCSNCQAEIQHHRKECEAEVIRGGLHWQCTMCGLFGVIMHNDSQGFCKEVRAAAGVQPPQQFGVKFSNCWQHQTEVDVVTHFH